MTLNEAIEEIREHGLLVDFRPKRGAEALSVIDKELKDYIEHEKQLRKANTEIDKLSIELKRANEIIHFQKEEIEILKRSNFEFIQSVADGTLFEPVNLVIDKETAKMLKLIGGDDNT